METWMTEYKKQLEKAVQEYPEEYGYDASKVPEVAERMREAFRAGSYNKEGRAIKETCKALKIRYTKQAISHFIRNHK